MQQAAEIKVEIFRTTSRAHKRYWDAERNFSYPSQNWNLHTFHHNFNCLIHIYNYVPNISHKIHATYSSSISVSQFDQNYITVLHKDFRNKLLFLAETIKIQKLLFGNWRNWNNWVTSQPHNSEPSFHWMYQVADTNQKAELVLINCTWNCIQKKKSNMFSSTCCFGF
jgi:hypothetical protein